MKRRDFLKRLALVPIGAVLTQELCDLLQPKKTIFLPPRGGWPDHGVWLDGNIGRYEDVSFDVTSFGSAAPYGKVWVQVGEGVYYKDCTLIPYSDWKPTNAEVV